MPAMTPTQIKTFARLSTLTPAAAETVRSVAAAAAVFGEAMRAGDGTPLGLRYPLADLDNDLNAAVCSLLSVASDLASIRRALGLSPAAIEASEAAYARATAAAELCAR